MSTSPAPSSSIAGYTCCAVSINDCMCFRIDESVEKMENMSKRNSFDRDAIVHGYGETMRFLIFIRSFLAGRVHSKWMLDAPSSGPCRWHQRSKDTSRGTRELCPQSMMNYEPCQLGRSLESPLLDRQEPRHVSVLILTSTTFARSSVFPSYLQTRRLGRKIRGKTI